MDWRLVPFGPALNREMFLIPAAMRTGNTQHFCATGSGCYTTAGFRAAFLAERAALGVGEFKRYGRMDSLHGPVTRLMVTNCRWSEIDKRRPIRAKSREHALEVDLFGLYEAWTRLPIPNGYTRPHEAERFRQTMFPAAGDIKGGVDAVQEYLVASGKWDDLFREPFLKLARKKLSEISK